MKKLIFGGFALVIISALFFDINRKGDGKKRKLTYHATEPEYDID